MTVKLSVNVNKIALLRNSRGTDVPHLMTYVERLLNLGVDGITVHPRADRRHITPQDARDIALRVKTVETNFEGDVREEFLDLVFECKPTQCTLVPVKPGEVTSCYGWDIKTWGFLLKPVLEKLRKESIRSSLFVETHDPSFIEQAKEIGADRVELYTAPYAEAFLRGSYQKELQNLIACGKMAQKCGIGLNAGHDLTIENLKPMVENIPQLQEVSIGHHLLTHALDVGLKTSVEGYLNVCRGHF